MEQSQNNINYKNIYADIYKLHRKYFCINSPDDWKPLIAECRKICTKYPGQFVTDFLSVVFDDIEKRHNDKKLGD